MDAMEPQGAPPPPSMVSGSRELLDAVFKKDGEGSVEITPLKEDYHVRIPNFQGPLDLLLHLIRKDQIDIQDIPIAQICRSYLEHLELMRQFDVNIAGEFMVMAATLIHIKSQILLPPKEEEEEEEDPRLPLVQQLLEYERYKEAADKINETSWLYRDIYPRPASAIQQLIPVEALKNAPVEPIDTFQLLVGLKTCLDRTDRKPVEISAPSLSLQETVKEMRSALQVQDRITLSSIIKGNERKRQTIMAFLAILELTRLKFIEILQHENFGPIQIRQVVSLEDLDLGLLGQY